MDFRIYKGKIFPNRNLSRSFSYAVRNNNNDSIILHTKHEMLCWDISNAKQLLTILVHNTTTQFEFTIVKKTT